MRRAMLRGSLFAVLSVAAHAALALVLRVPDGERPRREAARVIEMDLLPAASPEARSPTVIPVPLEERRAVPRSAASEAAPRAPERRPSRSRATEPRPTPAPLSLSMRGLDLELDPSFARRIDEARPPSTEAGNRPRGPASKDPAARAPRTSGRTDAREIKRRLDRLFAMDQAREDVRSGKVDPKLYDVLRDAETLFGPDWSLAEGDQKQLGTMKESVKSLVRNWAKGYLAVLEEQERSARARKEHGDQGYTSLETFGRMLDGADKDAQSLSCEMCVTIRWGQAPEVKVAKSSRRPRFDRLALEALRRAVARRQLAKQGKPIEVCYRFVAEFHRVPPLPVIGCSFDETVPSISCYYPGKKVLRARVVLISVGPAQDG